MRPPRTTEQAAALLTRYAQIDGRLAAVEAKRKNMLGRVNQLADAKAAPLVLELASIAGAVEPWWAANGDTVAPKGRKSAQLAGCMVGTRKAAARLAHGFQSDEKAVEALQATRYAKGTLKVTYKLDRPATLKLLQVGGKTSQAIADLGFSIDQGGETFFVQRVEQDGAIGAGA